MQIGRGPLDLWLDKQIGRRLQMKVVILLKEPSTAPNIFEAVINWIFCTFKVSVQFFYKIVDF